MNYNSLRRAACALTVAVLAACAALTPGCTRSDDTLGAEFLPDNQEMKAGTARLDKAERYLETRLYRTDSIKSSDLGLGYFGAARNDTTGLVAAGFMTQFVNYYRITDGYFGYRPIFDSATLRLSVKEFGRDTLTAQQFEVYEIMDDSYLKEDSVYYIDFDPTPYVGKKPLFTFTFPPEHMPGPKASKEVRMTPTEEGRAFVRRLMISDGTSLIQPGVGYDVYRDDARFVEVFKGLYIKPADAAATENGKGSVYGTELSASGFSIYGRNRVEEDPTLIRDTVGMVYMFYDKDFKAGNRSINTVRHNYAGSQIDPAALEGERPLSASIVVSGLGGVISEVTFTQEFFDAVERIIAEANAEEGRSFTTLAFNRALMSIYFTGGDYAWEKIDANEVAPLMTAAIDRLGAYTDYAALEPVPDYDFYSEKYYDLTLNYGGYINRSRACYVLDISGYLQGLWNRYLAAKAEAGGGMVDLAKVADRSIYLGPGAYDLYTNAFAKVQGMRDEGNAAPVALDLTYTLMK